MKKQYEVGWSSYTGAFINTERTYTVDGANSLATFLIRRGHWNVYIERIA